MESTDFSTVFAARVRAFPLPVLQALPVAVVLASAGTIAWHDRGSVAAADFLPSAVVVALLLAVLAAAGAAARPPRAGIAALGLFTALALWAGLSALWAPVPSLARDEALLVLFGVAALAVPLVTLRLPGDRLAALGTLVLGAAVLAVATALTLHGSADAFDVFRYRRLSFPVTYANASAGLFLAAFWPAVTLAGRRSGGLAVRVASLGAASLLLGTALLAQSKGAILGLAASTVVLTAVCPARLRLFAGGLLASAPVALAFRPLTDAYAATGAQELRDVHRAAATLALVALAGAVLGAGFTLLDRRGFSAPRHTERVVFAATAGAIVIAAAVVVGPHPGAWLGAHWRAFKKAPSPTAISGSTHLAELGSNRYDFWRVALDEFERHPLLGDGARGFGPAYLIHGRSNETPARAHSLPVELLGEEGVVGFALAAGGYGVLLGGLVLRARRRSAAATAALGGCSLLLAQACFDWTFTFPALTIPFFVLAGTGLAGDEPPVTRRTQRAGAAVAALVAVALFAPPWLSAKLVRQGLASRSSADLRWAHRLDPVSVDQWVAQAEIAPDAAAGIPPLLEARARAPRAVQVRYLLGSFYWSAGRPADATRELEAALALDPGDPAVEHTLAEVRAAGH